MGFADSFDKAFYIREKFVFCLMEGPHSDWTVSRSTCFYSLLGLRLLSTTKLNSTKTQKCIGLQIFITLTSLTLEMNFSFLFVAW